MARTGRAARAGLGLALGARLGRAGGLPRAAPRSAMVRPHRPGVRHLPAPAGRLTLGSPCGNTS